MTREFEETKVNFLGPINKAPWKKHPCTLPTGFSAALPGK